jgi:hypothetical protein
LVAGVASGPVEIVKRKEKLTGSFSFTTMYSGAQTAFLAAAAIGAGVFTILIGARYVKKALRTIS